MLGVCEDGVAICERAAELLLGRPGDDVAVPVVRVDHGDRESLQGGRPTMVDVLGVVLLGVAHGDGSGAGDRVDPVLFYRQALNRVMAGVAAVPRGNHFV